MFVAATLLQSLWFLFCLIFTASTNVSPVVQRHWRENYSSERIKVLLG
ncbi:hypothetical protein GLYMA_02G197350v4 [Glycine max]|nr:hypothetical protein GLYMA_02G197350v4 [Glycine max]KAH1061178.1 hypothetical protein GYH30_004595 [Glycine max]